MICKGFMKPDDICTVDMEGKQVAGRRKRTSEILLHLAIMKARDDVKSVVHCHPPHATAFAVAHEPIPKCILPEVEVFLGEVPIARYETPGTQAFAETVLPFVHGTNTVILANHGTVSYGTDLEDAYWKTEILDAYCRILILARQLGPVNYFTDQQTRELLDFKKRLGIADPRLECENCDLCGNSVFGRGYSETREPIAFPPRDASPGPVESDGSAAGGGNDLETLVRVVTDRVFAAIQEKN
jgi:L-fuculose-phosphate aldolase